MLKLLIAVFSLNSFAGVEGIEQFSANSRRERIQQNSQKATGFVKIGGCTGYFLQSNDKNRTYISSSRHCFEYKADQWCKGNNGFARLHTTQQKIKCLRIAAGDQTHDTIAFEFENIQRDRSGDFSYATTMPGKGTRLEMMGFPKDGYLSERSVDTLISTNNCRIVATESSSIYTDVPEVIHDKVFRHDCSTYGGNSGGPMMIEGTRIVVGIPDQFSPGSNPTSGLERGKSIQAVRADAFVQDLKHDLMAAGISVVAPVTPELKNLNYFANGSFKDVHGNILKVTSTSFYSDTALNEFTITGSEESSLNGEYTCEKETVCKKNSGTLSILITGSDKFSFKEESAKKPLSTYSRQSVD